MWPFHGVAGATWIFSWFVKMRLRSAYRRRGEIRDSANATGAQTAHAVLASNDMRQVQLVPVPRPLSDHYDPRSKIIRPSEPVYGAPSVAAMAIAEHETGHAIQDDVGYKPFLIYLALIGGGRLLGRPPVAPPAP